MPDTHENTLKNRMFVTKMSELSGGRLDPEYYNPVLLNQIDVIKSFENVTLIKKIHSSICTGFNNETRFVENGIKFLSCSFLFAIKGTRANENGIMSPIWRSIVVRTANTIARKK